VQAHDSGKERKDRGCTAGDDGFAVRIRQLATLVGGPKSLSKRSGLSRAVIGKYLRGRSEPSRDRLVRLAAAGGVPVQWLATGEGEMTQEGERYVHVPRDNLRAAAGGAPPVSSGQLVDHLAFRTSWVEQVLRADPKRLALIEAWGDAMAPTIIAGDLLLIEVGPFRQDGIYALARPDGIVVKRLVRRIDGAFEIRNDNPVYGSEIARAEALRIVGRVVWFGRRV
jgi:phage repressor protein C with HTH and peptisase S24 domain